jgi:hypothetical protein
MIKKLKKRPRSKELQSHWERERQRREILTYTEIWFAKIDQLHWYVICMAQKMAAYRSKPACVSLILSATVSKKKKKHGNVRNGACLKPPWYNGVIKCFYVTRIVNKYTDEFCLFKLLHIPIYDIDCLTQETFMKVDWWSSNEFQR